MWGSNVFRENLREIFLVFTDSHVITELRIVSRTYYPPTLGYSKAVPQIILAWERGDDCTRDNSREVILELTLLNDNFTYTVVPTTCS